MDGGVIESNIPARMDRLPWSRWHLRVIAALGTSWILDGLEVTLVGSLSGVLESKNGLSLSDQQVTGAATVYLAGAVIGALLFGRLTDRYGRRRLFLATVATYSIATLGTAFSVSYLTFALARFCTGLGIGGEYAAINSAVDELIPGKIRGRVDLFVNGTFWVGASLGAVATLLLLGPHGPPHAWGWRLAFGIGGVLGFGVLLLRLAVPESPRWLMLRGREEEARAVVDAIEREVRKHTPDLPRLEEKPLRLRTRDNTPWGEIFKYMLGPGRGRSLLGLVLMVGQAFFFNAMFFTFGLVAKQFYHQSDERLPLQLLPFAIASFLGPAILGPLFDRIGRKPMISGSVIFFVASAAASAAYLTVSEIFPLEIRALAIAIFYALGTLIGGVGAPLFFGSLIAGGSRAYLAMGYLLGAALMLAGALCEHLIGVEAAGKSLESISRPLQSVD